jgi:hypothetical protein
MTKEHLEEQKKHTILVVRVLKQRNGNFRTEKVKQKQPKNPS